MLSVDVIFFDVDGTLVDSRRDIADAINYTLRKLGLDPKPDKEIVSFIGTGVKDLVRKSLGNAHSDFAGKAIEIFSGYYTEHSTDRSRLYPHAKEILKHFSDKKKYVLTNRYKHFADVTLKGFGIREYFEEIIGGDDEKCLKPSACIINMVCNKIKMKKSRSIIVGDMAIDINTGKNSGIKTCWVTYGLGKERDVLGLKPDYVIDDLIELKKILI